jgi:acid phosphatase (class A)
MRRLIAAALLSGALGCTLAAQPAARAGAGNAAGSCPAPAPRPTYYVPSQVDLIGLIAPPPAAGSREQQADLEGVLAAQRAAHANGTLERALADSELTCARFKDVLGAELKSAAAARALKFISDAASNASLAANPQKRYWKRPRPFLVSAQVERFGDVAPDGSMAWGEYPERHCEEAPPKNDAEAAKRRTDRDKRNFERDNTSFPSGHAAYGMGCAVLLAEAVPEKRAELFARARQYGESRLILGAHFPTDVAAGQQAALLGAALVMQNASFGRQFVEAQGELRRALGLPVALPDLEPNKDLFKDAEAKDLPAPTAGRRASDQPARR